MYNNMYYDIKLKNGNTIMAQFVGSYGAFEGGMRYIFKAPNGVEYRCVKDETGRYVEYVA